MSNSASSSTDAAAWKAAEAELNRQLRLADEKRAEQFQESIQAAVANLPSNPGPSPFNRSSVWEGGAKKKRTTRTKKMKRRHALKSHRKSKRVMKR